MGSICINARSIIINKMWDEEKDLRPLHSRVPRRNQLLSVRNIMKIVLSAGNLLQKLQSRNHVSIYSIKV